MPENSKKKPTKAMPPSERGVTAKIKRRKKIIIPIACVTVAIVTFTLIYPYTKPTYSLIFNPALGQQYNYHFSMTTKVATGENTLETSQQCYGRITVVDVGADNITIEGTIDSIRGPEPIIQYTYTFPIVGRATIDKNSGEILGFENLEAFAVAYPTISLPKRPVRTPLFLYRDTWTTSFDLAVFGLRDQVLSVSSELANVTGTEYIVKTTADTSFTFGGVTVKGKIDGITILDIDTCVKKSEYVNIDFEATVNGAPIKISVKLSLTFTAV